ncbi:hypothetical protein RBH29_11405 [Herbivorax sp. ANBcel31]|uniref:DUF6897 domain-containing protein n=1 Tax=Herbivorax sp. ANBcel31 TaxID=3069754 RepID=UPI0027B79B8D|nr:hypothetical protein [Herbivorax sp. ANBcel31]MDQ2087034.1 hypothetical protein [Herbivorax sp. ANBcel31]
MNNNYLKQYVGRRVVLYHSFCSKVFKIGTKGVVGDCKEGWVELKRNKKSEYVNLIKIYSFRLLD